VPLFLMLAFLAKGVAEYVASVSSQWIANKAITDLRQQVFRHQMHLPIPVHQAETGGRMLSRILYDIPQVGAALSNAWIIVVRDTLIIIGLTGYLIYTAWELTLVIVAIAPVVAWLIRVASRKLRGSNRDMQETTGLTGMVEETLGGVREIKLFGTHDHEDRRFAAVSETLRQQTMRTVRVSAVNRAAGAGAGRGGGGHGDLDGRLPGPGQAQPRRVRLLRHRHVDALRADPPPHQHQRGDPARPRRRPEHLRAPRHPAEVDTPAALPRAIGELRFDDVSFATPARPGPRPSASTCIRARRWPWWAPPAAARAPWSTSSPASSSRQRPHPARRRQPRQPAHLRQQLGWVGQQVVLFDDTIAANIAYGRPDVPEADIIAAARAAHAMEFIDKLPDGLATRSAPTAASSPAASASASPSPAPSCATRRSCSSTKPPRPSTTNPSGR
jgi:subfamily B ATP-binding cassette protein MsbA